MTQETSKECKVNVICPNCKSESTIFPFYTDGTATYPCGCRVSMHDKVDRIEYCPVNCTDEEYEKLLDTVKQCNCECNEELKPEDWEDCLKRAREAIDYIQTYPLPDLDDMDIQYNTDYKSQYNDNEEINIEEYDDINNPFHYASMKYQPIDVSKEWTIELDSFDAICVHNILKYICRFSNKDGKKDLEKARWYLNKMIEEYE